jgi:hypothetical protein
MANVRDQALEFVDQVLRASQAVATSSPLLDDDLLERLRPLFEAGRETTGAEVRSAVLESLARFGFHPYCQSLSVVLSADA